MVSRCNQLILDFCNSLWRGKAFSNASKGSVFYMDPVAVDKTLDDQSMPESLSIYRHPAFLGFAAKFIEKVINTKLFPCLKRLLFPSEYLCKQFGPRSGTMFDLIWIQIV